MMQMQHFMIQIPDNATSGAALPNYNRLYQFLLSKGWNCTRATVYRHAKAGRIRTNAAGEFPMDAALEYARDHWQLVNPALSVPEANSRPAPADRGDQARVEVCGNVGLDAALVRLRQSEALGYQKWMDEPNAQTFRSYSQSMELLRKAEKNLLDLQKERRELLAKDEVKTWLFRQIISAKATLTNLPGKLAPQLEGLPWPQIQRKLEEEIQSALAKLSSDIDAPMAGGLEASGEPESVAMGGGQP
ncbi:hypothetical protein JCM14713_31840 [Desulfomicrobium salsuginis]